LQNGPKPGMDGHFFAAISIAAFEDVTRFKQRVDAAIREIHASPLAPGFDAVYAPGEREHLARAAYLRQGIPLNGVTVSDLLAAAHKVGLTDRNVESLAIPTA